MSIAENKAVFLSYASQDAEAAQRICEALRSGGVEVWFDADGGLEHGDEWDAKIRRQIKECVLFIPVISANTQARHEGYFRIEWELAAQRAMGIASGVPFILPVVIDDTREADALVPDRFRAVQWTRLRSGEVSADVQQRFLKLWSHRTGVLKHEAGVAQASSLPSAPNAGWKPALPRTVGRRVPAAVWAAGAFVAIVLIAVVGFWQPWRGAKSAVVLPPRPDHTATVVGTDFPRDPELARAWKLIMDLNCRSDDLSLAEDIVKRAVAQRPTDAEAAIVYTWLGLLSMSSGADQTDERYAITARYAERAAELAPDNPWALAGLARYLGARNADRPRAESLARRAITLNPREPRFYSVLAGVLDPANRDAVFQTLERAAALFPDDALTHYNLFLAYRRAERSEEADRELDRAIALAPMATAIVAKARNVFMAGDMPAMKALLDGVPATFRASERVVFWRYVYAYMTGQPDYGLQALQAFPGSWIRDAAYTGPKAFLVGDLLLLQQKTDLAQLQFESALAAVRQELVRNPTDVNLRCDEMWMLLRLGRIEEARESGDLLYAAGGGSSWAWFGSVRACLLLGERDRAVKLLTATKADGHRKVGAQQVWSPLLRVDPGLARWRDDPEINALLGEPKKEPAVAISLPDPKSVVVLPFANLSGDPAQEYFSDGLTEEILNALARERDLRVVPRTSAFSFKGKNLPLPEIAKALNVAQVVEGSVRRAGNTVRIDCTLTRVADGFAQPLPQFQREMKDASGIFALEDEVARAVVEKLTQRTTTAAPVAVLTKNSAAYDAFLRGRDLMNQTSPSWPKAVEALRRAVELDPQFAIAWANLGQLSASLYAYGFDGPALAASRRAIEEAVRLQPELFDAHLARANYLRAANATPEVVEHELEVAERIRPNDPAILEFRASVEFARGGEELGIKLMRRAVDLDPRNGANLNALGNELTSAGRYAEAEATYRQAFQILGSSIPLTNRARIYFQWQGDRALVARTLDEAPEEIRGERYWTSRALLLYATGDQPGALAAAAHMKPRSELFRIRALFTARMREAMGDAAGAHRDYLAALPLAEQQRDEFPALPTPYAILGSVYAGLGRKTEALAAVQKAIEGDQPGSVAASATGNPGLARKGISALTLVDLELDPHVALAQVEARFGMTDEALAIVQAVAAAGQLRRNYLLLSPDWAMLRKDPRFRAIAEKAPL